jgi:hypothetical protein
MPDDEQLSSEAMMDRANQVLEKYSEDLMNRAHVQGVGVGLAKKGNQYTNQIAIIVMVDKKVSTSELAPGDVIPSVLDGVPVDVQEMGVFTAQ